MTSHVAAFFTAPYLARADENRQIADQCGLSEQHQGDSEGKVQLSTKILGSLACFVAYVCHGGTHGMVLDAPVASMGSTTKMRSLEVNTAGNLFR